MTPSPSPTSEPSPLPTSATSVVINEIAWAGTAALNVGGSDEWIELYNAGSGAVDLTGWTLHGDPDSDGKTLIITLSGTIAPGAYYLIERTDDTAVSDILADRYGSFGGSGLKNSPGGEDLRLLDASGGIVDEVPCSAGWFAGAATPSYTSMERIDPETAGSDPANWASNDGSIMVGADAAGNPIHGTPAHANSVAATP